MSKESLEEMKQLYFQIIRSPPPIPNKTRSLVPEDKWKGAGAK
jgi:hypothetical protein